MGRSLKATNRRNQAGDEEMITLAALTGIFLGSTIALAWGFQRQRNLINHYRKVIKIQEMSH
jgi:hypothetical protein